MLLWSRDEEFRLLEKHIRERALPARPLQILEAGCGARWPIDLSGVDYVLTGVDSNREALESRRNAAGDLHEVIHGDLHDVSLGRDRYDIIYSSFVLEHVRGAEAILDRFTGWLRPGGLLILRIPDRDSVHGLVSRLTPFWFHVLYKKYVARDVTVGKPGGGPFPTYHERVVSMNGMREYCRARGLLILEERGQAYSLGTWRTGRLVERLATRVLAGLSFGWLASRHNNLTYVVEKPLTGSAREPR
jgi:SAM-dependent methyltransferase